MSQSYTQIILSIKPDTGLFDERVTELLTRVGFHYDYPPTMDYMADFAKSMHEVSSAHAELAGYGVDSQALVTKMISLHREQYEVAA